MRIFKNKPFARFARRNRISDEELCEAARNADRGLIDADLGGGVIKQRIARKGKGRSGGYRTILLFRSGKLAIFVHGFAKSDVENIDRAELAALKKLSRDLLEYRTSQLAAAVSAGALIEVNGYGEGETVP